MTNQTLTERLRSAIRQHEDRRPPGLNPNLQYLPKHPLVECRCAGGGSGNGIACRHGVALVTATLEGPLFIGNTANQLSMEVRNQRLKAHHQSPDTELRPRAVAASWTLTYALLVEGKWYGDLTANCDVHGIRPVQIGKLAAVTHDAGNLGKLKTVLF